MQQNLKVARPYLILLAIFAIGRWLLGVQGLPYARGNPVFSIVPMTMISSILYGALLRRWGKVSVRRAAGMGLTLALASQIVIWGATALSYGLNLETYFNNPIAITGFKLERVPFPEAMVRRLVGLVINSVLNALLGALGWLMGGTLPETP
jgi:hypothetical protein